MNITQMIERLQEIQENHGDDDVEVMGVHQMNYPLREQIGAVWDPENDTDYVDLAPYECAECGERITSDDEDALPVAYWNEGGHGTPEGYNTCRECALGDNHQDEDGHAVVYVRLDGAPYSINPYGSRKAWND